jgi:Amt family ammonium transporter
MMNIPGLALFYAGMVRKKNVLATAVQAFAVAALVTILWFAFGYSLAYTDGGGLNGAIGSLSRAFGSGLGGSTHALAKTVPENVFLMYQATFAIITPAIIAGAFAERMKFSAMMWFMGLWVIFVYVPVAHWVWGGGFLGSAGVLDFAGGLVVHLNAGIAGWSARWCSASGQGYGLEYMAPHDLVLTLVGTSLLWVGWFGFNAGSALSSGELAGSAMLNTHISAAVAALVWMSVEWSSRGKPSVLGILSGAVGGPRHHHAGRRLRRAVGAMVIGCWPARSATGPRSC